MSPKANKSPIKKTPQNNKIKSDRSTQATSKIKEPKEKEATSWFSFLFKPYNLLFGIIALFFLMWCNTSMPSYHWVYDGLLKGGSEYCKMVQQEIDKRTQNITDPIKRQNIEYDTKYEAKLGIEYMFLKFIREATPKNAIILFPPSNVLTQKTDYLTLKGEVTTKTWVSHFLYPRTIVYEQEKGKNPYYKKAQYIVVLHGWGFDHLDYTPSQRNTVDVLPLHRSK
jgi:hypothetical protein